MVLALVASLGSALSGTNKVPPQVNCTDVLPVGDESGEVGP